MTDKIIVSKSDFEHIEWIYKRLLNVHGENKNVDYMLRLKSILDNSQVVNSEPVAIVHNAVSCVTSTGKYNTISTCLPAGTKLFTTPQPPPDTVPRAEYDKLLEALKWLRTITNDSSVHVYCNKQSQKQRGSEMSIFKMPTQEEQDAEDDFVLSDDYVTQCMEAAKKLGFTDLKPDDFQKRQDALKAYYQRKKEFFGR